jgi:hypothetical protein
MCLELNGPSRASSQHRLATLATMMAILHLLGLDDIKLTYLHAGRYEQLSQFGGKVIQEPIS